MPKSVVTPPEDIWGYSVRDLTRTKFPFWSSIITQVRGIIPSAAAKALSTVVIQPSAGETWLVGIDFYGSVGVSGSYVIYYDYNGTTSRDHSLSVTGGTYGDVYPHLGVLKVLTSSLYARIGFYNNDTVGHDFVYGYSGFKLSQPLWLSLIHI